MEYTFTLKYRLSENDCDPDVLVERLGAQGCDDALIGVGQPGRIALEFTREGASAAAALQSALADVRAAIPDASLIEVGPDFVGLTDVAELLGMSRQNMRKLMTNHATSFPVPVHEGSTTLWHLADMLDWLQAKGTYQLDHGMLELAKVTRQINVTKESLRLPSPLKPAMHPLVA
ncbi:AlpA family transcriptional regulator [Lacisediminimonas sp.]|uniref:helix-turn-helix transcriptional regulator n=1 Tax=Lacisediminimonas sp. TaxID=3060582 RepID=UPI00271BABF2|nr:DNA-binding protein [Lacisediminimonas sp.]MDO8299438.1 DNA-binding protein [Lacisediminimonas sp.]